MAELTEIEWKKEHRENVWIYSYLYYVPKEDRANKNKYKKSIISFDKIIERCK